MSALVPLLSKNQEGKDRKLGVEIEFAGVPPGQVLAAITDLYGGSVHENHIFDYKVCDTSLGEFRLELDSAQLQLLGGVFSGPPGHTSKLEEFGLPLLTKAAEALVPWEVVTAPIPLHQFAELLPLVSRLKAAGAMGTRHAPHYAFGVHFNPELPDLKAKTILSYVQSFLCLYDWIAEQEQIDWARKLSPYIRHFKSDYIKHVLDKNYRPTMDQLIDDYLHFNPTRNRSLDLLPLFAFIDNKRVKACIDDDRVKARPTFHYRLPNCDIDNVNWNIDSPWKLWLQVEALARNATALAGLCEEYLQDLSRFTNPIDNQWLSRLERFVGASKK